MNKTEKDAHFKSQLSQAMVWGGDGVAAKGGALCHQESGRSPKQLILLSQVQDDSSYQAAELEQKN